MKQLHFINNKHSLWHQIVAAWIILLVSVVLFATLATLVSPIVDSERALIVAALVVVPLSITTHIVLNQRNNSLLLKRSAIATDNVDAGHDEKAFAHVKSDIQTEPCIRLNEQTRQVWVSGKVVSLTEIEFRLLRLLYYRAGQIVSKDELFSAGWPSAWTNTAYDKQIDMVICCLRDKIEPDITKPRYILTIQGRGYKLQLTERTRE